MSTSMKCTCTPTIGMDGEMHHHSECPSYGRDSGDSGESNGKAVRDELLKVLFASREEAVAAVPDNPPKGCKPFEISKGGISIGWILAIGYDPAISRAAQINDRYSASTGRRAAAPPSAEVIDAAVHTRLAAFTDEELATYGLTRAMSGAGAETTVAATVVAAPKTSGKPRKLAK